MFSFFLYKTSFFLYTFPITYGGGIITNSFANVQAFVCASQKSAGPLVLHISDTLSKDYPWLDALCKAARPDYIIHTGDLADELKIGRIAGLKEQYRACVSTLLPLLKSAARCELWVVLGNHDDHQILQSLALADRIFDRPCLTELGGVRLALSHRVMDLCPGAQISLYGHGHTGDRHDPQGNRPGGPCFFNGCRQATLLRLPAGEFLHIPTPQTM